ncbi:MAG: Do family serine endopeptidase [Alphaproteobacteria bacterium]|nr:Do family serine endopeptidase [Alphaproteobacteria bacterium]
MNFRLPTLFVAGIAAIGASLVCFSVQSSVVAQVPQTDVQIKLSFAPLVKSATPAVVNIYAKRLVRRKSRGSLFDDPFFNRFFGGSPFGGYTRERLEKTLGSGVIVRANGLIVTNHHVIENAQEITVVLADRREFEAKLVVSDKKTDIAILRVDTQGEAFPFLTLGNSDDIDVGDLVLAIGNPFGVGQTVTSGIVSALARTSIGVADYRFFIQTDAAINPGNSGGALIGMKGRLLGVNTAIYSRRGGGSLGIGFAVPSNMVRTIIESAVSGAPLVRPWLSFTGSAVNTDVASALGLRRPVGVLVEQVHAKGPGKRAGIRPGDVVVAIDRHDVDNLEALRFRIATRPIGETVSLTVIRKGKSKTLMFALVAPVEDPPRNLSAVKGRNPFAGVRVGNLSPAVALELDFDDVASGVIVFDVVARSTAAGLGFKPHDVIREVNGAPIERVEDLKDAISQRATRWRIVLRRGGRDIGFEVTE